MRIKRPSGLTLLTCALVVLLPALAVLQYRWAGQLSIAEQERMQRNLRVAAFQFRDGFDGEVGRAFLSLQVGPNTARDGSSERYSDRYDTWLNTATHPQIVANVYLVDADGKNVRLRRWSPDTHSFDAAEWPAHLDALRPQFANDLEGFLAGRAPERVQAPDDSPLLIVPVRNFVFRPQTGGGPQTIEPVFGFTVIELDLAYIREQFLPQLVERHFVHPDAGIYRVAVVESAEPHQVIYRSDPEATTDVARADAVEALFGRYDGPFFRPAERRDASRRNGANGTTENGDANAPLVNRGRDEFGRWRLIIQHGSGSLEAAVAGARRRNLAISFGVLLLLSLSVGLLMLASRHAHRLARQQMEFVAGVSHELRTPIAVIKSAAENLSHGVVGSGDRVKRYGQMIESEARRLGEMVERVLQYAGIESGLGLGSRAPLAPGEIIDAAIEGALHLLGSGDVQIQRYVANDLPPVIGDAAALRSAVQNLVANAVKYGGSDHWVGVRAELVRDRRRPMVRIAVSDHGAGIPATELPHIFEPFYRGADAIARQIHGNGLGLSLVRRIVAAHGGRVTVTSRPGGGSSFAITLPAAEPDVRATAVAGEIRATAHS